MKDFVFEIFVSAIRSVSFSLAAVFSYLTACALCEGRFGYFFICMMIVHFFTLVFRWSINR